MTKKGIFASLMMFVFAGTVFAVTQDEATSEEVANIGLTTYAGLAAFGTMAIGFIKKMWPVFVKGKEPLLAMAIPVVVGVVVKVAGMAFVGAEWSNHVVALIAAGIGASLIHDKIVNPVIGSKPAPKS